MLEEKIALKNLYRESDFRLNILRFTKIRRSDCVLFLCNSKEKMLENYIKEQSDSCDVISSLEELQKRSNASYDVIIYFDSKEKDDFLSKGIGAFFSSLKNVSKDEGKVFLALWNPLGVHTLVKKQEKLTLEKPLSKKDWEKGIKEYFPSATVRTYYPYPDHFFPISIYSDEHLPKAGELHRGYGIEEGPALELCSEDELLNNLTAQELFEAYNNSYLYEINLSSVMEEPVFVKYSNERGSDFRIATEVYKDKVIKRSIHNDSRTHILSLPKIEEGLKSLYEGNLLLNHCTLDASEEAVDLEFVQGHTLSNDLEHAFLQKDEAGILELAELFVKRGFPQGKLGDYVYTPQMQKVFGVAQNVDFGKASCLPMTDVDMIFDNLIVSDNDWILLDYEWTFDFPLPYRFVLYRSLFYFYLEHPAFREIKDLYSYFSFTEEELQRYVEMEKGFQRYICNGTTPLRDELLRLENRVSLDKIFHEYLGQTKLVFAGDDGAHTTFELDSANKEDVFSLCLPKDAKMLQIRPKEGGALFSLSNVVINETSLPVEELMAANTQVESINENTVILKKDVGFEIPLSFAGNEADEYFVKVVAKATYFHKDDTYYTEKRIRDLRLNVKFLEERIAHMENKAFYRLYKKIKKILKR